MILTLTGASGAGKTTIAKELLGKLPIEAQMIPSFTTRSPRDSDLNGEYRYLSKFTFWLYEQLGFFLWTAHLHGNSYGTTKRWARKALSDDGAVYIMLLVSDAVEKLNQFAEEQGYSDKIYSCYVLSPPQLILEERLRNRGDSPEEIEKRLRECIQWDSKARSSKILYEFVKNDGTIESVTSEVISKFLKKLDQWFDELF